MSTASVVISTYNGAAFLAETLNSVFLQTERPSEILIVDDCSTDETVSIAESLARESPVPLRVISLPTNSGGPSRPLNTGINAAKGEVILLLDQDDTMRPRRIELQVRTLEACPQCSVAIGGVAVMGCEEGDLTPIWPVPQFEELAEHLDKSAEFSIVESKVAFAPLLRRCYAASTSNLGFTRKWWRVIGEFDEKMRTSNDLDFMLRATLAAPIAIINATLFDYRWSPESLLHSDVKASLLESTMVRLRAASGRPEWAGKELEALRHSALKTAAAMMRRGEVSGARAMAETFARHNGVLTLKQTLKNKAGRLVNSSGQ
jgi:glycosyltransferase involved in cell wall biosynthesis